MYSEKRQTGNLGEDIAVKKLIQLGFDIMERNYLRKWGEIDIVARGTDQKLHFVEVKSTIMSIKAKKSISRDIFLPEENVTRGKFNKLTRVIDTWIQEHKYSGEWLIDVMTVHIDMERRIGQCKLIEGVTFD
jgi:putative endonuclease